MGAPNIVSDHLTVSISDHLPQFLVTFVFFNYSYPKSNKSERDCSKFDQENFVLDYASVDWDNMMTISNMNIDVLHKTFLGKFQNLSWQIHSSKRISNNILKCKDSPG